MKLQCFDFVLCALVLLGLSTIAHGEVLGHGTSDAYWIVTTRQESGGEVRSLVQHRLVGSAASWKTIARINARVRSMTPRGRDLAILLESGEWMVVWDGGSSYGRVPEDGSRLTQLAGSAETLWALGAAGAGRTPTTTGATQPAATLPADTKLLYRLDQGEWRLMGPLPNRAQDARSVSMEYIDQAVMLAALLDGTLVATFAFDPATRTWRDLGEATVAPATSRIKLLPNLGRPALWAFTGNGGGELLWRGQQWEPAISLNLTGEAGPIDSQDAAVAGRASTIRVLVERENKVTEHSFDGSGAAQGTVNIPAPTVQSEPEQYEWWTAVTAAALLIVLMNSMRRREPVAPEKMVETGLSLAPMGRRFIAGLIDASPVIGTFVVIFARMSGQDDAEMQAMAEAAPYPFYISTTIYILHTGVCEALWGWSIGKRLMGLRVIMIDGTPPGSRAVILRNLLRVLDVMTFFASLLIMFVSPYRQRIGDIVAETIVVQDQAGPAKSEG